MTLMGHVGCFSQSCVVTVVTVTVGTCVVTIQNYLRLQGRHASGENHVYLHFAVSRDTKLRCSLRRG
jgi:hypothetical protein